MKAQKKPWAVLWNVVTTLLVAVMVLLAVALAGVRILGYTPYAILSGSMTPKYQVGDLVYVKKTEPAKIQPGDVITFVADEELTLVTHRVVELDEPNGCVYTQGDANDTRDGSPVLYENIVGVVKFSLPKLGYVSAYFTSESGRYAGIALLLVMLLLFLLPEIFKPETAQDKKKKRNPKGGKKNEK